MKPAKSIEQLIKEKHLMQGSIESAIRKDYYLRLFEYYWGDNLTDDIHNDYLNDINKDYILENLQTHNCGLVKRKISDRYSSKLLYIDIPYESRSDKEIVAIYTAEPEFFEHNTNFKNLLDFYGYFLSYIGQDQSNSEIYILYIEPKFSENCNDFVYETCNGIVYHITQKRNVPKIRKSGLRIRNGDITKYGNLQSYRNFPKRIYLCGSSKFNDFDMLKTIADEVIPGGYENSAILKINVSRSSMNFYKDSAMNNPNCFFTYQNIPPSMIVQELHWPENF